MLFVQFESKLLNELTKLVLQTSILQIIKQFKIQLHASYSSNKVKYFLKLLLLFKHADNWQEYILYE